MKKREKKIKSPKESFQLPTGQDCQHQWIPLLGKVGKENVPTSLFTCLKCGEMKVGKYTIRMSRYRLDMGALPIKNLAVPTAAGDALRKGTRVTTTELPDAATGQFLEGGGAGVNPVYNALVAGDIPALDAAKITSGRFPMTRMPALASGNVMVGTGADPTEEAKGDFSAREVKIECRTSDPASPADGRIWLRTDL